MTELIETDEGRQEFLESPKDLQAIGGLIQECVQRNISIKIAFDSRRGGFTLQIGGAFILDKSAVMNQKLYSSLGELLADANRLLDVAESYISLNPEGLDDGDFLG